MKDLQAALDFCLSKLGVEKIKENQKKVIEAYLSGRDVLMVAPTGSGKSLTFQIAPFVLDFWQNGARDEIEVVCLVIAPLVSLMKDQVDILSKLGIKAALIGPESSEDVNLNAKQGKLNILFASPEAILNSHRGTITALKNKIGAVFIDEGHCIAKWGHGRGDAEEVFRKDYARLAELRSILRRNTPFVALTATATETVRKTIIQDLVMKDCVQLLTAPNKANIKFSVLEVDTEEMHNTLKWLIEELRTKKLETQKVIIFCRKKDHVKDLYETFHEALGTSSYVLPAGDEPMDDRTRLFAMYHKKTDHLVKESIEKEFCKENGTVRVVFCTIAFGMGKNVRGAFLAVHLGPSSSVDDYLQEVGRVGRSNERMGHAVLLKYSGCTRSKNITKPMKQYVKNTKDCRRKLLMQQFLTHKDQQSNQQNIELHSCCDICAKNCRCLCSCDDVWQCEMACNSKLFYSPVESAVQTSADPRNENISATPRQQVSKEMAKFVQEQLMKYRAKLALDIPDEKLLTGIDIATGFSSSLANNIVQNIGKIYSISTLKNMFSFLNEDHAVQTWQILCSSKEILEPSESLEDISSERVSETESNPTSTTLEYGSNDSASDSDDSADSDDSEVYVRHRILHVIQDSDSDFSY